MFGKSGPVPHSWCSPEIQKREPTGALYPYNPLCPMPWRYGLLQCGVRTDHAPPNFDIRSHIHRSKGSSAARNRRCLLSKELRVSHLIPGRIHYPLNKAIHLLTCFQLISPTSRRCLKRPSWYRSLLNPNPVSELFPRKTTSLVSVTAH